MLLAGCGGGGITPIRTPFNKGVYHQSRGELDLAIAEYRAALAEDRTDVRARFNLAAALDEQARALRGEDPAAAAALWREAEDGYRTVLELQPDNVRAQVNLAALAAQRGDEEIARALLRDSIRQHPELALPRTALAMRLLAAGDAAAAEPLLREALRHEPLDTSANLLLARVHVQAGRTEAARTALRAVLRRNPEASAVRLELAELERRAGNRAEALALTREVLLQDDADLDAHLLAADLARADDRFETAVAHLWAARDLDRGPVRRIDYDAALRELYQALLKR